ncbi:MAG: type II toxin-antitoxin system HicA family toxin [Ferruginibacter sp.]
MPKKLVNWTFKNVEHFLKKAGFVLNYTNGSHYYYTGQFGGMVRSVCVPFHGSNSTIKSRTFKSIILQSGIPMKDWMK